MSDKSKIEWTDATWNPITGCNVVSPGCTNCYAMKLAGGRLRNHRSRTGLTKTSKSGPVWNGEVRFNTEWLNQPLRWTRPRMIFVCAHSDLFYSKVTDDWIHEIMAVIALCQFLGKGHVFQILTKRPLRMMQYMDTFTHQIAIAERMKRRSPDFDAFDFPKWPLENVWLGVSVESQKYLSWRIPPLLNTPAKLRFLSAEPLLGSLNLRPYLGLNPLAPFPALDWVIAGGESGVSHRPCQADWVGEIRDACLEAKVPFFFKQWGGATSKSGGNLLDGKIHMQLPGDTI